ncbi:MAG: hypothetical protein M0P73_11315 [Syntrophobacterales bacterium]|jgi:hypothetical protein|nr:hypothetical protein [Syntrophobacterales bacterium]
MIKKLILIVCVVGLLALLLAPQDYAQQQVPPAAPEKAARLYNPQAVETLVGTVSAVNRVTPKRPGRPARVMMLLNTGQGTVKVHLGPADYLDRQALKLAAGDRVEVRGVRLTRPRVTLFMAGSVTKDGQVLQLRDEATGRPLWAAARPGYRAM